MAQGQIADENSGAGNDRKLLVNGNWSLWPSREQVRSADQELLMLAPAKFEKLSSASSHQDCVAAASEITVTPLKRGGVLKEGFRGV